MALAALIAAYHDSKEAGAPLRATLPLGGRSVVERQARLAMAAGATRILLVVERMPAELTAAIDRMRHEGMTVIVARTAAEAGEAIDADDRILLIADGFLGDEALLRRVAGGTCPALLSVPDNGHDDRFERIDSSSRWGGLALLDGAMLRRTAAMLRDWDLQSTLLRRLLQSGAERIPLEPAAELVIVERTSDYGEMQARALDSEASGRGAWVSRYLLGPLERLATRFLAPRGATPTMIGLAATSLTGLGAGAFATGFLWTGLCLMLLSTPLEGVAERLSRLRMGESVRQSWWSHILPALTGAALLALSYSLAETNGWGCILLAISIIAFLLAERFELEGKEVPGLHFLAERKGMIWLMLPFAATGFWVAGLAMLFAYAAGSFFWAQRQVHRTSTTPAKD